MRLKNLLLSSALTSSPLDGWFSCRYQSSKDPYEDNDFNAEVVNVAHLGTSEVIPWHNGTVSFYPNKGVTLSSSRYTYVNPIVRSYFSYYVQVGAPRHTGCFAIFNKSTRTRRFSRSLSMYVSNDGATYVPTFDYAIFSYDGSYDAYLYVGDHLVDSLPDGL